MEPLNAKEVTVLWHGWLKKLGGFSKRWKRRYFVFLSTASGLKELRHYDTQRDVPALLASTPKGVIAMNDATGICCFRPPSPPTGASRRHHVFNLMESHDGGGNDLHDQKFAVLTPLQVHLLAFQSGREWSNASESQQGLSLLASLSAFYPAVEVLHSGTMSKKRERTGHSAAKHSMMSYWKRHFFVFLSSGDLLYFKDETLGEFQGRVDVRHAPTVRVTGERMLEERRKEIGAILMKFAKLPTNDRESCLVWIATPPSKMFVLKLQEDSDGVAGGKRHELTASARKWLSLLLQGHAETKYTQLEQCISMEKFEASPEILSAVRAGIPDELRGAIWKGFSGAIDLQRRAELKRTIRKVTKTFSIRSIGGSKGTSKEENSSGTMAREFFDELAGPVDTNSLGDPENKMIFSRLCVVAMRELQNIIDPSKYVASSQNSKNQAQDTRVDITVRLIPSEVSSVVEEPDEGLSDSERSNVGSSKHTGKGQLRRNVHSSDGPTASWESTARRRLLIATSRFNPFSHPCPWKVLCLLLAYLDEESSFWVINSIQDVYLPGYFHGYRPALQVDIATFRVILEERASALIAHLNSLGFSVDRTVERWFLSLFTSTMMPLPTVLRVWDAFFVRGARVLFGVGISLFQLAEDKLFRAKSSEEVQSILSTIERTSIDADALFSNAFTDDLNLSWLSEERFDRIRSRSRQHVIDQVILQLNVFKDKLGILMQMQDHVTRLLTNLKSLHPPPGSKDAFDHPTIPPTLPLNFTDSWSVDLSSDVTVDSLATSLSILQRCVKSLGDAISGLSSDLNHRQAHWLALSSQLAGYPLLRSGTRVTTDLQSWLIQVKEGKISGAGLDALPSRSQCSIDVLLSCSNDQHGLYFGVGNGSSSLFAHMSSFRTEDRHITVDFLHAAVSALKAACVGRLCCLKAANCSDWHGGRWLQSSIEYPEDIDGTPGRSLSTMRTLRRSISNASKPLFASSTGVSRRANPTYDQSTTRNSLDDSVLRRQYAKEKTERQSLVLMHDQNSSGILASLSARGPLLFAGYDETYVPTFQSPGRSAMLSVEPAHMWDQNYSIALNESVPSDILHQHRSAQYRRVEHVIQTSSDSMMSCFSRFIRLENSNVSASRWELRERALVLEDDLVQSLKATEAIVSTSKYLF